MNEQHDIRDRVEVIRILDEIAVRVEQLEVSIAVGDPCIRNVRQIVNIRQDLRQLENKLFRDQLCYEIDCIEQELDVAVREEGLSTLVGLMKIGLA